MQTILQPSMVDYLDADLSRASHRQLVMVIYSLCGMVEANMPGGNTRWVAEQVRDVIRKTSPT